VKQLKRGGIPQLPTDLQKDVTKLVQDLSGHGLFLVPVGELECWFDESKVSVSKENKWAWANAAAAYIRSDGPLDGSIWDFIRAVARFLRQ